MQADPIPQQFEVKEILEPVFVLYLNGKEFSRHPSAASAWATAATISLNQEWLTRAEALVK